MKFKLQFLGTALFIIVVVLTTNRSAFAQEGAEFGPMDNDGGTVVVDREKILLSPGEADTRYISPGTTPEDPSGDSITAAAPQPLPKIKTEKPTPTPKPTVEKQSKKEDDSILSFNFLYYIIEKYKLQDIVER